MRVVSKFVLNLLLIWSVSAIRISPKLDFDEPEKKTLNVGFRADTEPRYIQGGFITKSSSRRDIAQPANLENIGVICISGNCSTTKTTTENGNGISADVLVHIKTNVDVAKPKNDSVQTVPDVPIVVGSKTSTSPPVINSRPITAPSPFIPAPIKPNYYPAVNPQSINTFRPTFLPSPGLQTYSQTRGYTGSVDYSSRFQDNGLQTFSQTGGYTGSNDYAPRVQGNGLQTFSQTRGYTGSNDYAPRFQGNGNNIDLQTYFRPYFNNYDNNNYQFQPQLTWHPKGARGGTYNPVEFRKTYSNTWNPIKWTGDNPSNSERRTGNAIPRWTPCVCQNPDPRYPTTPGYPQSTQPSGVNGRVASLV